MSSYFDAKTYAVSEASDKATSDEDFVQQVAEIERRLIEDVTFTVGDREFPSDLREKAMSLIAQWHVGTHATLAPRDEAIQYLITCRISDLVERMHSLFHEVASRRIRTRFGFLSDHPKDIRDRRDDHDAAKCERCGHSLDLHVGATGCNGHFSTGTLPRSSNGEYCSCGGYKAG